MEFDAAQEQAHVVWRYQPTKPRGIYTRLQPWQRYNQLPHTDGWDDKDAMAQRMEEYYQESQTKPLHSFPESYVLHQPQALRRFQQRLENGGIDIPWVLKQPTVNMGKGVTILGPQSEELKSVVRNVQRQLKEHDKGDETEDSPRLVIQQYICNEMMYQGRKFDFRVFWMVASVDPLIVLYHTQHNYVCIGHALYDESNFSSTKSHLTTHTFGAEEGKLTWSQFRDFVQLQYDDSLKPQLLQLLQKNNNQFNIPTLLHPSYAKPFQHVEDQIKTIILSHIVDAYKNITFHAHPDEMTSENAFTLHAADMILDNNLDVFLIEGTDGPGKDEDYDFRIDMHNSIFGEMVDIFEYVVDKQESGSMIDVEDMTQKGILGGYDVIYNQRSEADQDWMFDYRFERLPQKGCGAHGNDDSAESKSTSTITEAAVSTMSKTFYMPGRVYSDGEPVTRSFRRWGYKPVDNVEDAQIVYNRVEHKRFAKNLRPYQFVSPFPNEEVFFDDDNVAQYLDRTRSNGVVCDPLLYNGIDGRRFQIVVYWLVLSTDPLLALYHDGFLHFPYDPKDEDEFVSYEHGQPPVWRGSWSSFEKQLSENTNNRKNSMDHVRSQMKLALVSISRAFGNHAKRYQQEHDIPQRHYALLAAEFEVDRNLNVFLTDLHDEPMAGEEHQYVVDLHDELYGTTLGMLEAVNSTTMDDASRYSRESWIRTLEILTEDKLSGFEWLVRPATTGRNKLWSFQRDNTEVNTKECKSKLERPDITADAINWEKQHRGE